MEKTAQQLDMELKKRERSTSDREQTATATLSRYEQLVAEHQRELQRVAGLTAEEAKDVLIRQVEADARRDTANLVKRLEAEAREGATEKAKQIITQAIQRSAAEHAIETTVSVVDLPTMILRPNHRSGGT